MMNNSIALSHFSSLQIYKLYTHFKEVWSGKQFGSNVSQGMKLPLIVPTIFGYLFSLSVLDY